MTAEAGRWYILRVRLGFESLVASILKKQQIPVFFPPYHDATRNPDESGTWAFRGYVLARFSIIDCNSVEKIPGVLCVAGVPKPVPIGDLEIDALQTAIGAGLHLKVFPLLTDYHEGRVSTGPLQDHTGSFFKHKSGWYFAIPIPAIERTFAFAMPELSVGLN